MLVGVCMGQGGREGGVEYRISTSECPQQSWASGIWNGMYVCMYVCVQSGVGGNKETAINTKTKTEQVKDGGGDGGGGTVH